MHTRTLKDLQYKTIWLVVFIVLITGTAVAVVVLQPMRAQMHTAADAHIRHSLEITKLALDQHFSHFLDIGRQIVSRTQIRKRLIDYNTGKTTLDDVRAFSTPRLADALRESDEALGMVRLDPGGTPVATVGDVPPEPVWHTAPQGLDRPTLVGPAPAGGRLVLFSVTPIFDKAGARHGTDIVMYHLHKLAAALQDAAPGIEADRRSYLVRIASDGITQSIAISPHAVELALTPLPVALPPRRALFADADLAPMHALQGDDGRTWITAATPLMQTDLALVKMQPADTLYADARNTLYRAIATIALMVTVAALAVVRLLRSLSGQVLVTTEELQMEVDERKKAQQAAESANNAKSQFLASMSHELRTPLNSIIGFAEMMEYEIRGPLPENYQEYTTMITSSGRLLLETVNGILDLAKIEAGQLVLDLKPAYMGELIEEVLTLLSVQAKNKGLALVNDTREMRHLMVDPMHIKQVLLNTVGNAIKFTDTGSVTISDRCGAGGYSIIVSDTGIGMTPEQVQIALEPFKQVHGTALARRYQGTGLGLSLSAQIMTLHGGKLTIDSTPGEGCRVTLLFPPELGHCGP